MAGRFEECEARLTADPNGRAGAECLYARGQDPGQTEEAMRLLQRHLSSHPGNPYLAFYLAAMERNYGATSRAAEGFATAAEGFAARRDATFEGYARLNRSDCLGLLGDLEGMGEELKRAETAARIAGDVGLLIKAGNAQARLLRRKGEPEAGQSLLRRLERSLAPDAGYDIRRSLLFEQARNLETLGRFNEAFALSERWAALAREHGERYDEATARADMAAYASARPPRPGAAEEVQRLAREAVIFAERTGQPSAEAKAREILGKLVGGEEGRRHLRRCVALTRTSDEPLQQTNCLFALAGSLAEEQPAQAQAALTEALDLSQESEDPWAAAYGWAERFRVTWTTRARSEALADSLAALDLIEALRRLQNSETGRAGFFAAWTGAYHTLAGHLLAAPEDLENAFTVAERLRARVLLDSLAAARAEPSPPPEPALAAQHTAVLREIVRVQRQLQHPALSADERSARLAELDRLELDLAEVETRLGTGASPTALPETGFATLAEAEAALAPDEALLAFLVAPDEDIFGKFAGGSWLLAATRDGTRAYRLPGQMELRSKVRTFRGLIDARDDGELALGSVTLYDDLLRDALTDLPTEIDSLILVPDGVLHLLPFGLLRPHPQDDPLAEHFRLSEVPSATLWRRWRQQPAAAPAAALILADPAFGVADEGSGANRRDPLAAGDRAWAFETGARLGRLPYAAEEGRALLRRLGGLPNRLLLGKEATEGSLEKAPLGELGILHLAAHALVDEQRPQRSAVLLAAGGPDEDGLLQPREIAGLQLAGKLVVLSACETGSGRVLAGEGVQSLARAFFRAGARAVVASLWRLRDTEAAAFFDSFYGSLAEGDSVAEALTAAQRQRWREGAPAAAWAGVVVLGDGDLVPVPGGVPQTWPHQLSWSAAGALAAALLALGAMVWRRRRRSLRSEPPPATLSQRPP